MKVTAMTSSRVCRNHRISAPCEEATCLLGSKWYCTECATDMAAYDDVNPRDTTIEDERAAFNDKLDMYRNEF